MYIKNITILALTLAISSLIFAQQPLFITADDDTDQHEQTMTFPLKEGFVIEGLEGTVKKSEQTGKWIFISDTDISDGKYVIKTPTPIELLPTSTLEKITTIVKDTPESDTDGSTDLIGSLDPHAPRKIKPKKTTDVPDDFTTNVKLWARVTRYNNKNFLFPYLFLPVSESIQPPAPQQKEQPEKETDPPQNNETDSILPPDIMAALKPKRTVDLAKMKNILETEGDVLLVDRTGFLKDQQNIKTFTIDGLGRNIEDFSFHLLPCETLERTEIDILATYTRKRYKVAAIVTKYKNQYYMLLQRASRTYSHGNFAR